MTVTATANSAPKKQSYPKLMVSHHGNVVLFTQTSEGTLVGYDGRYDTKHSKAICDIIGTSKNGWSMVGFKDYTGTITLANE